jgi:demethylmenaquinone methyltransferase/2-methoxy-6-polyprenyl-1,4-benzoquinol methylase
VTTADEPIPATAWSDRDLAANPHARSDKPERVRRMFAAIAASYDLNNRVHSLWQDQSWRRFAVRQAAVRPTDIALDVACGTGDLTQALARAGAAKVIGLDFTFEMLEVARHKAGGLPSTSNPDRITYIQGDAQKLPLADGSTDVVTIAFGIRNVLEPARAIAEFKRVLRRGGRLVILEFAEPRLAPVRWFNNLYCRQIMPRTATWIAGDKSGAYKYLPKSVQTFLSPAQMCDMLRTAGFEQVQSTSLSMGICMCYSARV